MVARNIIQMNIHPHASLSLNLSYLTRQQTLYEMKVYEEKLSKEKQLAFPQEFFKEVTFEVHKLMIDNHWTKFKIARQNMQYEDHVL